MKVLKSLITLVVLLVAATQINAQQIDTSCKDKYCSGVAITGNQINVDISKAKSEAGDKHEKFTVIARPKVQDIAVLAIKQKGTWWKGILIIEDDFANCLACAIDEIKYGSASFDNLHKHNGPNEVVDGDWTVYMVNNPSNLHNGSIELVIAEAGFMGEHTTVSQIMNYLDLDPAYDWTFVWNE